MDLRTTAQVHRPAKIPRVGYLSPVSVQTPGMSPEPGFEAFRRGLGDLGYVEGENVIIEPRFAEGHYDRFPTFAAELVGLKVDVICVQGAVTVLALKKVIASIPIVFGIVADPVAAGMVSNVERPGGNVTGITSFDPQQSRKQLELLTQVIPGLARVAILGDQGVPEIFERGYEVAARALDLQPQWLRLTGPAPDLDGAFAAFRRERADALLVLEVPITGIYRKRIAELAARDRLPTLFARDWADAGGVIAYGTSVVDAVGRMPAYVDKILKGAKPGDLPVEQPTRYELVINLTAAQALGLRIPQSLLSRADQVIE
jgi:putative tryptophan/tyrosine transport system substrate-binding protein